VTIDITRGSRRAGAIALAGLLFVLLSAGVVRAQQAPVAAPPPTTAPPPASAPPASATPALGAALPESYPWVRLAEALMPAVVNVRTTTDVKRGQGQGSAVPEPFRRFVPSPPGAPEGRGERRGLGSGFVVDPSGYIVTNDHVVDGASSIEVTLSDGRSFPAKLVGSDSETDLALIKIEASGLPTIPLGSSSSLKIAEPVMAIGNPFGLDHTVTVGIISGTGRVIGAGRYDDFLQTDAAINPGNSGGPLINTRGEVIGIASAIATRSGGFQGVGFAIPIDLAKPILGQLRQAGKVTRGWLGVTIQTLTPELAKSFGLDQPQGALVAAVSDDSPAGRAGLKPGDVIVRYDGKAVDSPRALPPLVANTPVGKAVTVEFLREGGRQSAQVTVGNLADAREAQAGTPKGSGESQGRVTERFGLALRPLTPELAQRFGVQSDQGVVVTEVRPDSPAAVAGLAPGDVIREVNRTPVRDLDDVERGLQRGGNDPKTVLLRVEREGSQRYVVLALS
jgi:serine protease Do